MIETHFLFLAIKCHLGIDLFLQKWVQNYLTVEFIILIFANLYFHAYFPFPISITVIIQSSPFDEEVLRGLVFDEDQVF